ncbi:hypothetical protein TAMA11512_22800 [Selenomonas sp. TAMA-11512]|uniref:hypothetical protein n=1 Tax=Selenomonas sp. TAMA-11512 TaxID=3095337 RepID=UPI003089597E|nr:hypothetical protein TAMA11512_22800 [Selenomonas sp. TAMA-11512]
MRQKILTVCFLALALVLVGMASPNKAEARHYYVGTYSDGTNAYLVTESIVISSYHPYTFTCTVVYENTYLYYSFFPSNGSPYYRNSEGYEGYVFGGASPVAANIYRFVVQNY